MRCGSMGWYVCMSGQQSSIALIQHSALFRPGGTVSAELAIPKAVFIGATCDEFLFLVCPFLICDNK